MTTIQTADGRLLRSVRPQGAQLTGGGFPSLFPPLWSNGETATDGDAHLVSYESIYRSQPVIAAVVDKLARRIATLPFAPFRLEPDGNRVPVRGDGLDSLLRRPMPRYSTLDLNHHIAQSLFIHGNAVVAKLRGPDPDGPPVMLWPLDWSQMSAYGPHGGRIEWWSTTQFEGVERFISIADTMHFAWGAPSGGEVGVSPLEKLGVTIRLDDATVRHQTAMFKNGARPSLSVSLNQENPKLEILEYTRDRVEAMHKGVDNAGRTFFTGANVNVTPLSLSPVEAELIEQRRLNIQEIGMVYDLAGPLMNDLTHGTYSNVAELLKGLYRDVIPPTTELMVQTFQAQMLDLETAWMDRVVRFDFADKLKGEPVELAQTLRSQVEAGLITRNEARMALGYPPDGDPADENNPANKLTANVNNQASLDAMGAPAPATQ